MLVDLDETERCLIYKPQTGYSRMISFAEKVLKREISSLHLNPQHLSVICISIFVKISLLTLEKFV